MPKDILHDDEAVWLYEGEEDYAPLPSRPDEPNLNAVEYRDGHLELDDEL